MVPTAKVSSAISDETEQVCSLVQAGAAHTSKIFEGSD